MNKSRIMKVETLFLYFSLNTNVCGKLEVAFYVMVFGEICVRSDIFFFLSLFVHKCRLDAFSATLGMEISLIVNTIGMEH